MPSLIDILSSLAAEWPRRVVLPEGTEPRIVEAAVRIARLGAAVPILLGEPERVSELSRQNGFDPSGLEIVDIRDPAMLDIYAREYSSARGLSEAAALRLMASPLFFGAMMVRLGEADTLVAGLNCRTEDVIMASSLVIGTAEGISTPSSFMILRIPGYKGTEGDLLAMADPAVVPDPDYDQLAEIAIATADSVRDCLGWEPRVAMLSFSTKGSAMHPLVDKVVSATTIVKQRRPDLLCDGEFQVDAALVPEVAARKLSELGAVAGRANVLIFPGLEAANIGYKLVQRLVAGTTAYGPLLQGFAKPASDLSRGSSVEDILGTILLTLARVSRR